MGKNYALIPIDFTINLETSSNSGKWKCIPEQVIDPYIN